MPENRPRLECARDAGYRALERYEDEQCLLTRQNPPPTSVHRSPAAAGDEPAGSSGRTRAPSYDLMRG
jgi:hypothetical protein